jgi:hypothetical protein
MQFCGWVPTVRVHIFLYVISSVSCIFHLTSSYTLTHKTAFLRVTGPLAYSTARILILWFMFLYHFS